MKSVPAPSPIATANPYVREPDRFATAFTWLAGALAVGTLFVFLTPGIRIAALAPEADLVINTAATIAAGCVAAFAWIRYRDSGRPDALLQSLAFLTLCLAGALRTGLQVTGNDIYAGFTVANPGQAPVYSWTTARLVSGILLLTGAVANLNGWGAPRRRIRLLLVLAPVVTIAYSISVYARDASLAVVLPAQTVQDVVARGSIIDVSQVSPRLFATELFIAFVFVVGAIAYAQVRR